MSGLPTDSGQSGESIPPPGTVTPPPQPAAAPSPLPVIAEAPETGAPLTPAQQEAVARVTELAAARPPAAERVLSRAATVTLVALGVLVLAMVMLAALVV